MATWADLKSYIHVTYTVSEDIGSAVSMLFRTGEGRSQKLVVTHAQTGSGMDFAVLTSGIADVGQVDLAAVLTELNEYVVGGAVIRNGQLVVRHAVPLDELDAVEFEKPLHLVTQAADLIEAKFVGSDQF